MQKKKPVKKLQSPTNRDINFVAGEASLEMFEEYFNKI